MKIGEKENTKFKQKSHNTKVLQNIPILYLMELVTNGNILGKTVQETCTNELVILSDCVLFTSGASSLAH